MDEIWCQTNFDTIVSFDPIARYIYNIKNKKNSMFL